MYGSGERRTRHDKDVCPSVSGFFLTTADCCNIDLTKDSSEINRSIEKCYTDISLDPVDRFYSDRLVPRGISIQPCSAIPCITKPPVYTGGFVA